LLSGSLHCELTRFKPVGQVGAIDLERVANLAGMNRSSSQKRGDTQKSDKKRGDMTRKEVTRKEVTDRTIPMDKKRGDRQDDPYEPRICK
jgi:hypothetical protein